MSEVKLPEHVCLICKIKSDSSEENILRFGEWNTSDQSNIAVHNFCLYFLNKLKQRAKNSILESEENGNEIDGENILGFLVKDLKAKVKKNKPEMCRFCRNGGAGTWCINTKCKSKFHFDCGQKNGVQYQFYGEFVALCPKHYDLPKEEKIFKETNNLCLICVEPMTEYHKLNLIRSCCKLDWYHRDCVKKTAYHQGYAMKCMSCGSKKGMPMKPGEKRYKENTISMQRKEYIRFLEHRGIFVPKRDANWELTQNAYAELLPINIHLDCNATECLCENGRAFAQDTGTWEIIKCITCGGRGIHTGCFESQDIGFICTDCHIESQSQDFYRTLNETLAMAEPIPRSQSPEPIVNSTIIYVRKNAPAYEAKRNRINRDDPNSKKGWYNVDAECLEGKRKMLVLRTPREHANATKQITNDEYFNHDKEMRNECLNHFFESAQFRSTPISYMPAIDQLRIIWDKEAEKKKAMDAAKNDAAQ